MSAAPPRQRRERNVATLHRYFELLSAFDITSWSELWAEDCVQAMPFAAGAIPARVRGRTQVKELYQSMADDYVELRFADLEILPLEDADKVLATWKPRGRLTNGHDYANENVALFEFGPDGHIAAFTEYFNPTVVDASFPAGRTERRNP